MRHAKFGLGKMICSTPRGVIVRVTGRVGLGRQDHPLLNASRRHRQGHVANRVATYNEFACSTPRGVIVRVTVPSAPKTRTPFTAQRLAASSSGSRRDVDE